MVSFSRSVWKKLHRAEKIYTGSARGARNNYQVCPDQADAYPWIAALLREEDILSEYINSKCSAVLVGTSPTFPSVVIFSLYVFSLDWQQICTDSSSLSVRRRQQGSVACQLLLHHARPPRQEEDQGAKQVTLTP